MVVDRTGLTGLYDFETELAMDPQLMTRQLTQARLVLLLTASDLRHNRVGCLP
jgi:hypothetical protein